MGKYLDLARRISTKHGDYDQNDINDRSPAFGRFGRLCRYPSQYQATMEALECRCPNGVAPGDWRQAIEDGRRFMIHWGRQAEGLGWGVRELFGLAPEPDRPAPHYRRLSRYDETGLIWLLRGRPVVALTECTAAIQSSSGDIMTYRAATPEHPKFPPRKPMKCSHGE
jgi:hypothetical protein